MRPISPSRTPRLAAKLPLALVLPLGALLAAPGRMVLADDQPIPIAEVKHEGPVDFEKEVLPILRKNCLACHNSTKSESDLVLETPQAILKGGAEGPAAVAGKGAESLLVLLAARQRESYMPPDGNDVGAKKLTSEELGLIKLWIDQGATGEVTGATQVKWQPLPPGVNPIYSVSVSDDGQYLAAARANQVFLYHLPSRRELGRLSDPKILESGLYQFPGIADLDLVQAVKFSPDGSLIATGGFRTTKLWRREAGAQVGALEGIASPVRGAAVSADGKWIALALENNQIQLFDAASRQAARTIEGHTGPVTSVQFTADSARLVSGSTDKTLRVWNVADGAAVASLETPAEINAVAAVGEFFASAGADNAVHLWTLPKEGEPAPEGGPKPVRSLSGHGQPVTSLTPVGDNQLLSGSLDGSARLWNTADGATVRSFAHGGPVAAIALAPSGVTLATAGANNIVKLWNVADGKQLFELKGDFRRRISEESFARVVELAGQRVNLANEDLKQGNERKKSEEDNLKKAEEEVKKAEEANTQKTEAAKKPVEDKAAAEKEVAAAKEAATKAEADQKAAVEAATKAAEAQKVAQEAANAAKTALDAATKTHNDAVAAAKVAADERKKSEDAANAAKTALETAVKAHEEAVAKAKAAAEALEADKENKELAAAKEAADKAVAEAEAARKKAEEAKTAADKALEEATKKQADADKVAADADAARKKAEETKTAADKTLTDANAAKNAADQAKTAADQAQQKATAAVKPAEDKLKAAETAAQKAIDEQTAAQRTFETAQRSVERSKQAVQKATEQIPVLEAAVQQETAAKDAAQATLDEAKKLTGESERPWRSVAFSPDGATVAAGGEGNDVFTWDVATGAPIQAYAGLGAAPTGVRFLPDGTLLGAAGQQGLLWSTTIQWKLAATIGAPDSREQFPDRVTALAFSPDGKVLATGSGDPSRSGELKLWNTENGELIRALPEAHSDTIFGLEFSHDGQYLASCGADRFMKVFNVADGSLVRAFEGHTHHVLGVSWSADGRTLATSGADMVIKVWDFQTGDQKRTITGFNKELPSIRFIGNSANLIAACGDKSVHIRRANDGGAVRSLGGGTDFMYSADATADGKLYVGGGQDSVLRIWSDQGQSVATFEPPKAE